MKNVIGILSILSIFILASCTDTTSPTDDGIGTGVIENDLNNDLDNDISSGIIDDFESGTGTTSTGITQNNTQTGETNIVTFYLYSNTGSDMSGDISRYLVPVRENLMLPVDNTDDKIEAALESLFDINDFEYGENNLQNSLYRSDLEVDDVSTENGVTTVNLSGNIVGLGAVADAFTKLQITRTIEEYTDNYEILLNNSESQWRCALDATGECV